MYLKMIKHLNAMKTIGVLAVTLMIATVPEMAFAADSIGDKIGGEKGWLWQLYQIRILLLGGFLLAGIGFIGWGVWIWIKSSDNPNQNENAGKQAVYRIVGGSILTVITIFIGIFVATMTGDGDAGSAASDSAISFEQ